MFPAGKKFFITLYKAPESFLLTCQDPAALNSIILQMTYCVIEVPTIELMDDLKEEERLKVGSKEGICYSLMNDYYKTFYIYPNDTVLYNNNVTQGYKPPVTISCMPVMQRHLVMFYFCVNACVLAKEVALEKKCFSLKMVCLFLIFLSSFNQ